MIERSAHQRGLADIYLRFTKDKHQVGQFLQKFRIAYQTLQHFYRALGAPTGCPEGLRRGVEHGNNAQTLCKGTRLSYRQHMEAAHQLLRERHINIVERVSRGFPTFFSVQHVVNSALLHKAVPGTRATGHSQDLSVERGKKDHALLHCLFPGDFGWGGGKPIRLTAQSPNRVGGACRNDHSHPGNTKCNNGDSNGCPGTRCSQGVPPHHAVVNPKWAAAEDAVEHCHSLIPLWIERHFATAENREVPPRD